MSAFCFPFVLNVLTLMFVHFTHSVNAYMSLIRIRVISH